MRLFPKRELDLPGTYIMKDDMKLCPTNRNNESFNFRCGRKICHVCYMKRLRAVVLFLILFLLLLITGCNRQEELSSSDLAGNDGEIVIRLEGGDWGYPSPYAHYPRGTGGFKMCLIFDSLLERDEKGLIPWLAKEYEILDNGKKFLFTIRKGVKWHDGKPLTIDDVCFSFEYASKHPMTWSYIFNKIQKVEKIAGEKVMVTTLKPDSAMLYNLGRTRIIPIHIWKDIKMPKEFTAPEAVTGCGPYCLTSYSKEHGIYRLKAFEDYWGPKQNVKIIEYIPVSESVLAFEKGEIDMTGISADILPRFQKSKKYKIVKSPGFWGFRLLFNFKNSALKKKKIRQAIRYAIDLDELVVKNARGAAISGNAGILPPDHLMFNHDIKKYQQDYTVSEKLLSETGYDSINNKGIRVNSSGEALSFKILCSRGEVRMVEILKEQLMKAGILVNICSTDGKTRDARVRKYEYNMAIIGHGGWGGDPDYLRERFGGYLSGTESPSSSGLSNYNNHALNQLLEKQHVEMDGEKREAIVYKIQQYLAEDVLEIPLFYTTEYVVYRPAKYDGWICMFDHHSLSHSKLSYLQRKICN